MKKTFLLIAALMMALTGLQAQNSTSSLSTQSPQLFLPLTFYSSVAHDALSLDGDPSEASKALLEVYLTRPDLVQATESELRDDYAAPADEIADKPAPAPLPTVVDVPAPVEPETPDVDVEVTKPNFWTFKGDGFLQFLQNYVSGNWYKGGESNYSMLSSLTLEANYNNKSKLKWDNKLEMKLGFQTSRSDTVNKFKANEDLIRLTSKLGLQATKHWYYTIQLLAYTQFTRGLKPNDLRTYSDFMSPFNLNVSIGMDYTVEAWNKKLTGNIHLAPLAYNLKYVDRRWFDEAWMPKRYGIEDDKHVLHDFGPNFTVELKWAMAENITYQTRMYGFSSFRRVEWEWENTFTFQFNKYISTKLFLYPRFDDSTVRDDHHGYFQFQEFMSIGFNYSF